MHVFVMDVYLVLFVVFVDMHFKFLCKKFVYRKNKFITYTQKTKCFDIPSLSSNLPGNSQKIAKPFLNGTVNVELLLQPFEWPLVILTLMPSYMKSDAIQQKTIIFKCSYSIYCLCIKEKTIFFHCSHMVDMFQ